MKNTAQKGFSLIEIIIVVTMISLFSGLSIAGYHSFNEEKKLTAEVNKLVEAIELAKKRTIAGEKRCNTQGSNSSGFWYMVKLTNTSYSIRPFGTSSIDCSVDFTYTLTSNFTLTYSNAEIVFYLPVVQPINRVSSSTAITITNTTIGKSKQILIQLSGVISIL
ncbi:MAG: hypothetical protein ACD_24C00151G0002 [uncultured bacterium]|nr:MAG: hypothetical protein ACD_24C00151G0002 [uncultured bacterium]